MAEEEKSDVTFEDNGFEFGNDEDFSLLTDDTEE